MFDDSDKSAATVSAEFRLPAAPGAKTAAVVGDFNEWAEDVHVMRCEADGGFFVEIDIPVGRTYQYRYLIDGGRWENDWNADDYAPNVFGGEDSVLDLTAGSWRLARPGGDPSAHDRASMQREPVCPAAK